jgi:hypothetical protein
VTTDEETIQRAGPLVYPTERFGSFCTYACVWLVRCSMYVTRGKGDSDGRARALTECSAERRERVGRRAKTVGKGLQNVPCGCVRLQ